jgi:hypothetical protein
LTAPVPEDFACFSMAVRTFVASLPLTVSRTRSPLLKTRKGTAVTLKLSLTSMTSSASMQIHDVDRGSVAGYEEASVCRTVVICLHYSVISITDLRKLTKEPVAKYTTSEAELTGAAHSALK